MPSPVFPGNGNTMMKLKLCKAYASGKCQQGDELVDTLERQTIRVNKYEGTLPMASFNKKTCVITEKKFGVKIIKIHNCFCKYAIEDNQVA